MSCIDRTTNRLTLVAAAVFSILSLQASAAEPTKTAESEAADQAVRGTVKYFVNSNEPYSEMKVMPDGSIIGTTVTNHGKGVRQQMRMPNFDNITPVIDPVVGKDSKGRVITERQKKMKDLQWKAIGGMVKEYNDGVKAGTIQPVEKPKETQLEMWQRQAREAAEYEKKHGPIQTSKNYKMPGLSPEESQLVRSANTQIRYVNGQPEYLVFDEENRLKQIIRPNKKKPYVAKFKKSEPVRRDLGSKVIYSSDEKVDISDVNNPETKRIKALFPDIGKTPEQRRYIIHQNQDGTDAKAPASGKPVSLLDATLKTLLGIRDASAQTVDPDYFKNRPVPSGMGSVIDDIAKSAQTLQEELKAQGALTAAPSPEPEDYCDDCKDDPPPRAKEAAKAQEQKAKVQSLLNFSKDVTASTEAARQKDSEFSADLNEVIRSVSGGDGREGFLKSMGKVVEDHPDVRKALPNVDKEIQSLSRELEAASSTEVPANAPERTLVFVSYSMSEQAILEAFRMNKGREDVLFVMQGIPAGMNIATGVRKMQLLASKVEPTPNIVLDPGLFDAYDVKVVPTLVRTKGALKGGPTPGKKERAYPKMLGKVRGLTNDEWLLSEIKDGKTGDLGTEGNVVEIAEKNLIDVMKERVAKIDWAEKKKKAFERAWTMQKFDVLPTAQENREREIDPTFVVENDIKDAAGNVIRHKGEHVNPLEIRPFTMNMLVFNPLSRREKIRVDQILAQYKAQGYEKPLLVGTQIDRDKGFGWGSYKEITDYFDAHLFMLTPEVKETWALEQTPALIYADNDRHVFRVTEFGPTQDEEEIIAQQDRERAEAQQK